MCVWGGGGGGCMERAPMICPNDPPQGSTRSSDSGDDDVGPC